MQINCSASQQFEVMTEKILMSSMGKSSEVIVCHLVRIITSQITGDI
jgi:hypothetical protein